MIGQAKEYRNLMKPWILQQIRISCEPEFKALDPDLQRLLQVNESNINHDTEKKKIILKDSFYAHAFHAVHAASKIFFFTWSYSKYAIRIQHGIRLGNLQIDGILFMILGDLWSTIVHHRYCRVQLYYLKEDNLNARLTTNWE